jgi:hypothetical protein
MLHDAFLIVMSQLAGSKKARVVIQGMTIFFETSERTNHLTLYTKVYSGDGALPPNVRACVSSSGMLRWQARGAYLKLDAPTYSVYLIQEIDMETDKYIPFKHYVSDFSIVAAEWRDILQDFEDSSSVHVS